LVAYDSSEIRDGDIRVNVIEIRRIADDPDTLNRRLLGHDRQD
jgi:hypothetical protein